MKPEFSRLVGRVLFLACTIAHPWPAAAADVWSEMMPANFVEHGVPVALELVIYRPDGPGPFPTMMFNHGSTGSGTNPAEFAKTWHSPEIGRFFNDRGWMAVFPQRRGRGKSGGLYDEGFGSNRALGYTCDPVRSLAGMERALSDLDAVIHHLRSRVDVQFSRLLIGGWSRGGILSIVHAGTRPGLWLGAVNFVGGWMSDSCTNPAAINTVSFARGGGFAGPTIWLYGEGDPFYALTHSRANFAAFTAAGGTGTFNLFNLGPGQSGHTVLQFPDHWSPLVEALLARLPPPVTGEVVPPPPAAPLMNVATRATLGAGGVLNLGFVIGGRTPRRVLVRAIGPGLGQFGVTGTMADPKFTVLSGALPVGENDDWGGNAQLHATFAAVGAFGLPGASKDAAIVLTLAPGAYTVVIRGANSDDRGEVLAEVYLVE